MCARQDSKNFTAVRKLTDNKYLNLYEMDALTKEEKSFQYYFASRNLKDELPALTGETKVSGIVIYPLWKENVSKIVLIRQYRYPLNRWIYELPAGVVDQGETVITAAIREMKEETGLQFEPYSGGSEAFRRPLFLGAGMTDETSCTVFGYASGKESKRFIEDSERIEVVTADRIEVIRILEEEQISLRAAMLLMQFLQMKPEEPFDFLNINR